MGVGPAARASTASGQDPPETVTGVPPYPYWGTCTGPVSPGCSDPDVPAPVELCCPPAFAEDTVWPGRLVAATSRGRDGEAGRAERDGHGDPAGAGKAQVAPEAGGVHRGEAGHETKAIRCTLAER